MNENDLRLFQFYKQCGFYNCLGRLERDFQEKPNRIYGTWN